MSRFSEGHHDPLASWERDFISGAAVALIAERDHVKKEFPYTGKDLSSAAVRKWLADTLDALRKDDWENIKPLNA